MIQIISLQNDEPRECSEALAGFELDPTIADADPRAAALVAALPTGWRALYFGRFDDGRLGVMGSGHPDVPVAIETEPPANGKAYSTTADVAAQLGITPQRVRDLARARGVGERYGRDLVFRPHEVAILSVKGKPGRRPKEA